MSNKTAEKNILINLINGLNTRVVNIPNLEDFINAQYNQNNIESIEDLKSDLYKIKKFKEDKF